MEKALVPSEENLGEFVIIYSVSVWRICYPYTTTGR
jgi:hypothetical protein